MTVVRFDNIGNPNLDNATILLNNAYKNMQDQINGGLTTVDDFAKTAKQNNDDMITAVLNNANKQQLLTPGFVDTAINTVVGNNLFGYNKAAVNKYIDERPTILNQRATNELNLQDNMLRNQENQITYQGKKDEYDSQTFGATLAKYNSAINTAQSTQQRDQLIAQRDRYLTSAQNAMSPAALYKGTVNAGNYNTELFNSGNSLVNAQNAQLDKLIGRSNPILAPMVYKLKQLKPGTPEYTSLATAVSATANQMGVNLENPYIMNSITNAAYEWGNKDKNTQLDQETKRTNIDIGLGELFNNTQKVKIDAQRLTNSTTGTNSPSFKAALASKTEAVTKAGWGNIMDTKEGKASIPLAFADLTNKAKNFTRNIDTSDYVAGDGKPYKTLTQYAATDPDGLVKSNSWNGHEVPEEYIKEINKQRIPEAEKIELFKLASQGQLDAHDKNALLGGVQNNFEDLGSNVGIQNRITEFLKPDAKNGGIPNIRSIVRANKQKQFTNSLATQLTALDQAGISRAQFLQETAPNIQKAGITHLLDEDSQAIVKAALASSNVKTVAEKPKNTSNNKIDKPISKITVDNKTYKAGKDVVPGNFSDVPTSYVVTQAAQQAKTPVKPSEIKNVSNAIKSIMPKQSGEYEQSNIKSYADNIRRHPEMVGAIYKQFPQWESAIKAELAKRK